MMGLVFGIILFLAAVNAAKYIASAPKGGHTGRKIEF